MAAYISMILLSLLTAVNQVTSFTITKRQYRTTNIDDTTAILQRIFDEGTMGHGHQIGNIDLRAIDIPNWLSSSNMQDERSEHDLDPVWNSHIYLKEKDIEPSFKYEVPQTSSQSLPSVWKLPRQEFEYTFVNSDQNENFRNFPGRKLDPINELEDINTNVDKKSNSLKNEDTTSGVGNSICLKHLTNEELKVLTKVLDTTLKSSSKVVIETVQTPEIKDAAERSFKSSNDAHLLMKIMSTKNNDVPSVYVTNETAAILETKDKTLDSIEEQAEDKNVNSKVSQKDNQSLIVKQMKAIEKIVSDIQDNAAELTEKEIIEAMKQNNEDWNIDSHNHQNENHLKIKNYYRNNFHVKRNGKRTPSIFLPSFLKALLINDHVRNIKNDEKRAFYNDLQPFQKETLTTQILNLEGEISKLKMIIQLEGLENDVLTDTLNEASLGQADDSVTDLEFKSLQEALHIEDALQDLKKSKNSKDSGRRWRQQQGPYIDGEIGLFSDDAPPFYDQERFLETGKRVTKDDIQRLLGQTYLLKEEEETDS